jgi:hypothetical protein
MSPLKLMKLIFNWVQPLHLFSLFLYVVVIIGRNAFAMFMNAIQNCSVRNVAIPVVGASIAGSISLAVVSLSVVFWIFSCFFYVEVYLFYVCVYFDAVLVC